MRSSCMPKERPTRPWKKNRRHRRKKCPFILWVPRWSFWEAVLNWLERWLQRYELSFVMPADSRLGAVYDTLVTTVTLTLTKETL